MKPQTVRLLDVFFIGPLMIYGGGRLAKSERVAGGTLAVMGLLTILYNGKNWLDQQRLLTEDRSADRLSE